MTTTPTTIDQLTNQKPWGCYICGQVEEYPPDRETDPRVCAVHGTTDMAQDRPAVGEE